MYNSVIILAGGFGTRLKGISNGIPKALMPIGSRAYLDLLLDKVFQYKISDQRLTAWNPEEESCEDYLTSKGHNLGNCEWMVHDSDEIITN